MLPLTLPGPLACCAGSPPKSDRREFIVFALEFLVLGEWLPKVARA
jgi:hypothetical protein